MSAARPKKFVVTGTSAGIGRALAERLLSRGHHVWGLARSDQSDFAAKHPVNFRATRCDVSDWSQISRAAADVVSTWKIIDGLVTCAGSQGAVGPALHVDPIKWSETVRANLDGTYFAIRAFADYLFTESESAKIVCFSGGGATKPRPNFSAYGAAKTAIVRLVETIAAELEAERRPIDINAIAPGAIATRLTDEVIALGPTVVGPTEYASALRLKNSDENSLGKALDLVEWLLSSESDGISGRLISAQWDDWAALARRKDQLASSDIYTLRRILPEDRERQQTGSP